jgi:hypothetical protein
MRRIIVNIAKLPELLAAQAYLADHGCLCVCCSSVWQRRNRANVIVCARSYSVTADVRLVIFDEV